MSKITYIPAPREGVNDDVVRVVEWRIEDGERVTLNHVIGVVETTKAAIEVAAPCSGYFFRLVALGSEVTVGMPLAAIGERPERPAEFGNSLQSIATAPAATTVVTAKARPLMEQHGLTAADFPSLGVIRVSDVQLLLASRATTDEPAQARRFRNEVLDAATDWDAILARADARDLNALLDALRRRMKARFDRHVPTGSLLHDRWQLARDHGFGEGTSVYDECLILGQVTVGKHCWVGPFTVLDGQGGLSIGNYVDIGAGAHIYTHNTIERALTGHRAPMYRKGTRIGDSCFIAPHAMIGPGTVLGDHCFVAAGSYVEGVFPERSYIAGNPGRVVGHVANHGARAHLQAADRPSSTSPNAKQRTSSEN